MILRSDGTTEAARCVSGWGAEKLRPRLVFPRVANCGLASAAVEEVTELPEVMPRDCRRGRALTPWGVSRLVWCPGSVFQLEFDESSSGSDSGPWGDQHDQQIPTDDEGAQEWMDHWVGAWLEGAKTPLRRISVSVSGTPFQRTVWRALLGVPRGSLTSYSRLAAAVGSPGAARAVGAACGANPVALLVPCHRVIRESGELSGYRWGMDRKLRLLAGELGGNVPW
jgi:AraC family transcriptional regulator of adaptative response/methylated-DNA-[protein]-cysteine methyltransferase